MMVVLGCILGLDEKVCCEVGLGGFLYDVGKVFLLYELFNKLGKLIDEEFI